MALKEVLSKAQASAFGTNYGNRDRDRLMNTWVTSYQTLIPAGAGYWVLRITGKVRIIKGIVPLAETFGYATNLSGQQVRVGRVFSMKVKNYCRGARIQNQGNYSQNDMVYRLS